jgi:hypothetical protein
LAPGRKSSSGTPKLLSAHDTRLYWPTVKTASMSCSVEYFFDSAAQVVSESARVLVEVVGDLQERSLVLAPALGLGAFLQVRDVGVGEAAALGDELVLGELVLGLVQPADAQDQKLAVAEGQGLLGKDVAGKRRPALHELRMMGQHLEDVEDLAVHDVLLDRRAVLRRHGRKIAHGNALLALDHRGSSSNTGSAI